MTSTPPDEPRKPPAPRTARLVGRIADPAADDGLSLSGPGAPETNELPGTGEHPVKARLLARARLASGEGTEADRLLAQQDDLPRSAPSPKDPMVAPGAPSPATEDSGQAAAGSDSEETVPTSAPEPRPSPPPSSSSDQIVPPVVRETPPPSSSASTFGEPAFGDEQTSSPSMTPPPGAVASELDRIARRSGGHLPTKAGLSPNMTALLSTLLGLCLVGSIGLFAAPIDWKLNPPEEKPAPAPTPTTTNQDKPDKPERQKVAGPWRVEDDRNKPGHQIISGQIGNQAFLRTIQDAGLPKGQAYRAYGALKEILDLDHCRSSDTFRALVKGSQKELIAFEYEKSKEEVYQAKEDETGHFVGKQLDLKVERNQVRRGLVFDGKSFEDSARRGGFDPGLKNVLEDAFRGHLSIRELDRGDRLRVIAQEVTVLGEFSRYSGIEAVEILRPDEEPQRIYYYSHATEGGYFDENGRAPYEGGWRKPIPTAPITSKFNMKRMHPVLDKVMPHTGTDFGAAMGTPIGATAPGVVTFRGNAGASGNLVKIKHDGGYESGYAHLSRFEKGLNVGDEVDRLETIGYCGSTGRSTGPHLHFTMKKDGKFIDPESLNLDGLRVLPPSHRPAFAEVRAKYDPILDAIELPAPLDKTEPQVEQAEALEKTSANKQNPMLRDEAETSTPDQNDPPAENETQQAPEEKAGAPAKTVKPSAIFLTDQELLRMQTATDDGEVSE